MPAWKFQQVDVFTATPLKGNPLAVVIGADAMTSAQMAAFANWTNLSETAFLLAPTSPDADYKVRIFTPAAELPFAGHPTLGAGLVRIRPGQPRLAFAAPPVTPVEIDAVTLAQMAAALRIEPSAIVAARKLGVGAAWHAALLRSQAELLAIRPDFAAMAGLEIGVIAPADGGEADFEVRGFAPDQGIPEDPVTGSLNAGLARWVIGAGLAPPRYIAAQGTCLGRAGRVHVRQDGPDFWIGGDTVTCIEGSLTL
jgi:predicted PhzF superfamily epimerase YddE/YHI9